jgi:hypothetical protein
MKAIYRITESDLHRIVKESVNRILKESGHEGWSEEDWNPNYPSDDEDDYEEDPLTISHDWREDHLEP